MTSATHSRKIDAAVYIPVLRQLMDEGRQVPLTITGNSMSPFLIHERDKIIISAVDRPLKKGDMAFYQRWNGQYIMHRVYRVAPDGSCYFVGDAQTNVEGPIAPEQIFGLIVAVERKGKRERPGTFWWEFFEHFWLYARPIRPVLWGLYRRLFNRHKQAED